MTQQVKPAHRKPDEDAGCQIKADFAIEDDVRDYSLRPEGMKDPHHEAGYTSAYLSLSLQCIKPLQYRGRPYTSLRLVGCCGLVEGVNLVESGVRIGDRIT